MVYSNLKPVLILNCGLEMFGHRKIRMLSIRLLLVNGLKIMELQVLLFGLEMVLICV